MVEKVKQKLIDEGFDDYQIKKILNIFEDFLPIKNKKNVTDILRNIEKKYQKKFGDDEIFITYPIPAKLRIRISDFKRRNNISYDKYCKFGEWILEMEDEKMNVYNLIDQRLYNKFEKHYDYDKYVIDEKKEINKPKLFRLT